MLAHKMEYEYRFLPSTIDIYDTKMLILMIYRYTKRENSFHPSFDVPCHATSRGISYTTHCSR